MVYCMLTMWYYLQNQWAVMEKYTKRWKLRVNVSKTTLLRSKSPKSNTFMIHGVPIEEVKSFKYLGFTVSCNSSLLSGVNELTSSAQRAYYSLLRRLRKFSTNFLYLENRKHIILVISLISNNIMISLENRKYIRSAILACMAKIELPAYPTNRIGQAPKATHTPSPLNMQFMQCNWWFISFSSTL